MHESLQGFSDVEGEAKVSLYELPCTVVFSRKISDRGPSFISEGNVITVELRTTVLNILTTLTTTMKKAQ